MCVVNQSRQNHSEKQNLKDQHALCKSCSRPQSGYHSGLHFLLSPLTLFSTQVFFSMVYSVFFHVIKYIQPIFNHRSCHPLALKGLREGFGCGLTRTKSGVKHATPYTTLQHHLPLSSPRKRRDGNHLPHASVIFNHHKKLGLFLNGEYSSICSISRSRGWGSICVAGGGLRRKRPSSYFPIYK